MASPPNPNATMATPSLDSTLKSFKMDRRSPEASNLRLAVSQKLLGYLGKYFDDVLAEYIVVLVCNGKNQIEARKELDAFLGKDSENFVIWLWDHLSEQTIASVPSVNSSDYKTELKSPRVTSVAKDQGTNIHNYDVEALDSPSSKEHPEFVNSSMGSSFSKTTDDLRRFRRHNSMDVSADKEKTKRLELKSLVVCDKLDAKEDENLDAAQTSMYSIMKHSSDTLCSDEKCAQHERQHQKISKSNPGGIPYQPLCAPNEEVIARNMHSIQKEIVPFRSVLITRAAAMDVDESRINRPRGCVWDRLGRPVDDERTNKLSHKFSNDRYTRHHSEELHDSKSSVLDKDAQLSGQLIESFTSLDDGCARVSSDNYRSKYEHHRCDENGSTNDFGKLRRKRQYGNVDSVNGSATFSKFGEECVQDKFPKKQESLSVKYDRYHKVDVRVADVEGITTKGSVPAAKSSTPDPTSRSIKVVPAQVDEKASLGILNQDSHSTDKIDANLVVGASRNTSTPTADVMLNVKEKLLQVERDMLKLKAKQADLSNLKNTGPTGPHNNLEDVDSRTVLVTNVHFAASREALSNYFRECGPIAKVTMLNDPVTAQPKGAAYIVFASKESADRAISCSGSSFFSRLLKVMRKAEVPPGFLSSTQAVIRPQQSSYPQFPQKGFLQKNQMGSHLQWRRNDSKSKENSLSSCADDLQSSNNGN